jgi:hypothetical protein
MIQTLKEQVRNMLRPLRRSPSPAEQSARVLQERFDRSEVIFVCFPKCGSTWLEVILTQYLVRRYGVTAEGIRDLHRVSHKLPNVKVTTRTHDDDPHLKTVDRFETDKSIYKDKGVLLLVRDPRDVVVSYFFEYTKKKEHLSAGEPPFLGTVDDFMHHKIGGLRAIIRFYNIWAEKRQVPRDFVMVTYEDLHKDTMGEISRLLRYLDKNPVDETVLAEAVAFGRFDNMRALEEKGTPGLRLNPNVQLSDTEGYKVRKGKVGGYSDYLSPASTAEADRIVREELSDFFSFYKT